MVITNSIKATPMLEELKGHPALQQSQHYWYVHGVLRQKLQEKGIEPTEQELLTLMDTEAFHNYGTLNIKKAYDVPFYEALSNQGKGYSYISERLCLAHANKENRHGSTTSLVLLDQYYVDVMGLGAKLRGRVTAAYQEHLFVFVEELKEFHIFNRYLRTSEDDALSITGSIKHIQNEYLMCESDLGQLEQLKQLSSRIQEQSRLKPSFYVHSQSD